MEKGFSHVLAHQHVSQKLVEPCGAPAMGRIVVMEIAVAPGPDVVFKTGVGAAGMDEERVEVGDHFTIHSERQQGLQHLESLVMVEYGVLGLRPIGSLCILGLADLECIVLVSHDPFLIGIVAHGLDCLPDHRIASRNHTERIDTARGVLPVHAGERIVQPGRDIAVGEVGHRLEPDHEHRQIGVV